jgi:hypothetical protein|uniref:Uncharacterized protein n=1 Tax=Picea glauca TaxID=3330 RepID=A0A101LUX5_PICGL|nr:hypothetical protein ABT39_MTgene2373 [Picea glauca]QHR92246.1 hypothetical protein Q903MT_gene6285 [Picea sitchensis]
MESMASQLDVERIHRLVKMEQNQNMDLDPSKGTLPMIPLLLQDNLLGLDLSL